MTPVVFGEKAGPEIYCFWHQCVLPCTLYFRKSNAVILISRSFDGELITRILKMFGFDAVRGSSSRGAREGLLGAEARDRDRANGDLYRRRSTGADLPDKNGADQTGAVDGCANRRISSAAGACVGVEVVDRFLIPKPFTRIVVSWAQWTQVAADLPAEQFEAKRQELNDALERARLRALEYFGQPAQ